MTTDSGCACMQSFEALNQRAVAVVVDPIQSVKGKVVIDAFRWASLGSWGKSALGHASAPCMPRLLKGGHADKNLPFLPCMPCAG